MTCVHVFVCIVPCTLVCVCTFTSCMMEHASLGDDSCVLVCKHVSVHVYFCMHFGMRCWSKRGYW